MGDVCDPTSCLIHTVVCVHLSVEGHFISGLTRGRTVNTPEGLVSSLTRDTRAAATTSVLCDLDQVT